MIIQEDRTVRPTMQDRPWSCVKCGTETAYEPLEAGMNLRDYGTFGCSNASRLNCDGLFAPASALSTTLPIDSEVRKGLPLARGFLYYFPAAVAEVARLSQEANEKHNPGEEMHWARGKSMDHADCILRHQVEAGTMDTDGFLHDVKVAWRAMAQLQEALEARGAPIARGAR